MDHSQPASMQDVAKAASVSPQTVSRVANGSNAVRPETRQRVEAAMAKLGYRPNYAARALKHGKFKDVGVVLFNMLTYGNARILGGIATRRTAMVTPSRCSPSDAIGNAPCMPPSSV